MEKPNSFQPALPIERQTRSAQAKRKLAKTHPELLADKSLRGLILDALAEEFLKKYGGGHIPLWGRMVPSGGIDPYFSLRRQCLNYLCCQSKKNNFSPAVRSVLVKKPGAARGFRMIDYSSLAAHLSKMADEQAAQNDAPVADAAGAPSTEGRRK